MQLRRLTRSTLWIAVLLVTIGAPNFAAEKAETLLTLERPLIQGQRFELENLLGSVVVRPGTVDQRTVEIQARVVAEAGSIEDARALVASVSLEPQTVDRTTRIEVGFPVDEYTAFRLPRTEARGFISRWVTPLLKRKSVATSYAGRMVEVGKPKDSVALAVYIDVTLPLDVTTSIKQMVGPIHCSGLRGDLSLEGVMGSVIIDQLYGSLDVRTTSGDIEIYDFRGDTLNALTSGGKLRVGEVDVKDAMLSTRTGSIEGGVIRAAELRLKLDGGQVKLDEVEPARLSVESESGSVDLGTQMKRLRHAEIRSGSGNVILRLGTFAPFELKAESASGSVKTKELSVEVLAEGKGVAHLRRGSGGTEWNVTTQRGGVTIRRLGPGKYNFAQVFNQKR